MKRRHPREHRVHGIEPIERVESGDDDSVRAGTARLTGTIDRANIAGTRSFLYAPTEAKTVEIPGGAWTEVAYS